jgi:dihydrofolate reductase
MQEKSGRIFADIDISLDGFVAGENISKSRPLGDGGERLIWYDDDVNDDDPDLKENYHSVDAQVLRESAAREGAVIMGRTTFEVSLDDWGENPPIHKPCFVLTNRLAPEIIRKGGTSFTFVTSLDEALSKARRAANGRDVGVMGGARTIRRFLEAGLLDELHLHLVPVLLGRGLRLFDGLDAGSVRLRAINAWMGNQVVHLSFGIADEQTATVP